MTGCGQTDDVLEKCIKEVLSVIKPLENDRNLRLEAIKELTDSISSVETLTVAVVKPFGSFVSNLYAKSGDLDISVELPNDPKFPTNKLDVLKKVQKALETEGIPRDVQFIPRAIVPIIQYVSNRFGISCDVSVDNYPGRIKSRVFYWIATLDWRFRDMVLLVKEWAKSQDINDPKKGTLNSYSLCLLVVFHFQTCKPAILPPLKEIYGENSKYTAAYCDEDLDKVCQANIETFRSQNTEQRNQSSLSHLLATFFQKFSFTETTADISTFEGRLIQITQADPPTLLVSDPFEKPSNAARAVTRETIDCITSAFNRAKSVLVLDGSVAHRNELLSLLCTREVGKRLGVTAVADPHTPPVSRFVESVAAKSDGNQCQQRAQGFRRTLPSHSTQGYNSGCKAAEPCSQKRREDYTLDRQANIHGVATGYEPACGRFCNDPAKGSRSQASSSSQHDNGNRHLHNLTKTDGPSMSTDRVHLSNYDMLQILSILQEELEEPEEDHLHLSDDITHMLRFLHIPEGEDDNEDKENDDDVLNGFMSEFGQGL